MLRKLGTVASLALVIALLLTLIPSTPASAATENIIYETGFDAGGLFIVDYQQYGWSRGDYVAGQDDTWCRTPQVLMDNISQKTGVDNIPAHSPGSSLWCAKIGTNSINHAANIDNGYPDRNMESYVRLAPKNATRYDNMTLNFWYWAYTGENSTNMTDYLSVNINNGNKTTQIWKQPSANSQGWREVTLDLPKGTIWMEWDFKTGSATPSGGPYPGAFLDDVKVTASGNPPTTSIAGPLNSYYNVTDIQIPYKVSDQGMGLDYVELYYRLHGWPWTQYTTSSNPDGQFTSSPIAFEALEDGQYDFYTLAMDDSGNLEEDNGTADISIVVDTAAPTTTIYKSGEQSPESWFNSSVTVAFKAEDKTSDPNQTYYKLDGGDWNLYSDQFSVSDEGTHPIEFYSVDKAGNTEAPKNATIDIDSSTPVLEFRTESGKVFTSPNVLIAWNMSDPQSNISTVQLSVDGGAFENLGGGAYLCTINNLRNGTHAISLRIADQAGNSVEKQLEFAVDLSSQISSDNSSLNPLYALVVGAVAVVGIAFILHPSRRRGKK